MLLSFHSPQFHSPQFLSLQHNLRPVSSSASSHWHQLLSETLMGSSYHIQYYSYHQDPVHHPHCQLRAHCAQPHSCHLHSHSVPLTAYHQLLLLNRHLLYFSCLYSYLPLMMMKICQLKSSSAKMAMQVKTHKTLSKGSRVNI